MQNILDLLSTKKSKVLMTIFPHPDDETFGTGGLLSQARKLGWKTIVVTLTKGGAGKIFVHGMGRSVIEIREVELAKAARIFDVSDLIVGDFNDAQLVKQEDEWLPWIKAQIVKYKPSVIVTYDHSGLTGHPDHIISSLRVCDVVKKDPRIDLFWVSMEGEFFNRVVDKRVRDLVSSPTHVLKLSWADRYKKFLALWSYQSQFPLKKLPLLTAYMFKRSQEWYHKVDSHKKYPYKFVDFKL